MTELVGGEELMVRITTIDLVDQLTVAMEETDVVGLIFMQVEAL
jgi:hypothetical protein